MATRSTRSKSSKAARRLDYSKHGHCGPFANTTGVPFGLWTAPNHPYPPLQNGRKTVWIIGEVDIFKIFQIRVKPNARTIQHRPYIKKVCQRIIGTPFLYRQLDNFTLQLVQRERFVQEPVNLAPQEPDRPVQARLVREPELHRSPGYWRRWCSAAEWRYSRARFPLSRP